MSLPGHRRRSLLLLIVVAVFLCLAFLTTFKAPLDGLKIPYPTDPGHHTTTTSSGLSLQDTTLKGHVIAPKLENATVKEELGRAAWKLFHTTFARFPDKPTTDESNALKSYIYLFQRLYPCGECAEHFGLILEQFPPQVSSRSVAAVWGCHVHNEVNKSLGKELFDCSKIGDFYDCGCAEGEEDGAGTHDEASAEARDHEEKNTDDDDDNEQPVVLEVEEVQRGG